MNFFKWFGKWKKVFFAIGSAISAFFLWNRESLFQKHDNNVSLYVIDSPVKFPSMSDNSFLYYDLYSAYNKGMLSYSPSFYVKAPHFKSYHNNRIEHGTIVAATAKTAYRTQAGNEDNFEIVSVPVTTQIDSNDEFPKWNMQLKNALDWVKNDCELRKYYYNDHKCVINMSIGYKVFNYDVDQLLTEAKNESQRQASLTNNQVIKDVINNINSMAKNGTGIVMSAGNGSQQSCKNFPQCAAGVAKINEDPGLIYSVGALDSNGNTAKFSDQGFCVNTQRLGTNVYYGSLIDKPSGTSFSAPQVAGELAFLYNKHKTYAQLKTALQELGDKFVHKPNQHSKLYTTENTTNDLNSEYNWNIIDTVYTVKNNLSYMLYNYINYFHVLTMPNLDSAMHKLRK